MTGNVFFAFIFIDPPGWVKSQPYNSRSKLRVSDYILTSPGIVGRRLHRFRLRLTTASVCRAIDCALRLAYAYSRHPRRGLRVSGASSAPTLTHYLHILFRALSRHLRQCLRCRAHSIAMCSATSACYPDSQGQSSNLRSPLGAGRHSTPTSHPQED